MDWIDISHTLSGQFPSWPGEQKCIIETQRYTSCVSSTMHCSLHAGTHIDAPLHFVEEGSCISDIQIDKLVGKAQIVEITDPVSIKEEHIENLTCNKILFKTRNQILNEFHSDYCYIEPSASQKLVNLNIDLVGIDYLSVEKFNGYETHKILLSPLLKTV